MSNYTFDSYYKSVEHSSEKWASTDRGWMFLGDISYGNYLDYTGVKGWYGELVYPGKHVHAVVFDRSDPSLFGNTSNYRYGVFESVQSAKEWMITEKTGQLALGV